MRAAFHLQMFVVNGLEYDTNPANLGNCQLLRTKDNVRG